MLLLIPLLPFLGFLVNAFLGKRLTKTVSGGVACLAMIAAFAVALIAVLGLPGTPGEPALRQTVYDWLPSGDLKVPFELYLDPLSSVMILVITGIGSLIHIYSTGYMHDESDSEYARYFSYLNLFASFMLVLVLGANFPVMFVGWEGVGLCSYLLIGFWFRKPSAADAGKKAFVVNRVGDFGFVLGMLLIFATFGTLDFQRVAAAADASTWKSRVPNVAKSSSMASMKPKSPMRLTMKAFLPASAADFFLNQKPISRYEQRPTPSHPTNITGRLAPSTSTSMNDANRFRYEK